MKLSKPSPQEVGLNRFCKQRELTGSHEDRCYLERRDHDSRQPLKFVTYQYHPYGCEVQATCYPGQYYDDGHVSGCNIDSESQLKLNCGNVQTNRNLPQNFGAFPVMQPQLSGCFHVDVNSDLRWEHTSNWKPCTQLAEVGFNPYRFQFFDNLCFDPQKTKHLIQEDSFRAAYKDPNYHYAGQDTRHNRLERYRDGCDPMFRRIMDSQQRRRAGVGGTPYSSKV